MQERAYSDDKELKRRDSKRKKILKKRKKEKKSINNLKINETEIRKKLRKKG